MTTCVGAASGKFSGRAGRNFTTPIIMPVIPNEVRNLFQTVPQSKISKTGFEFSGGSIRPSFFLQKHIWLQNFFKNDTLQMKCKALQMKCKATLATCKA
jgi:hypothetical protein